VYGVNGSNHVEFEGVFLTGAELRDLFRLRTRGGLKKMRDRGELLFHQLPNGYFLYPEDQPAIRDARASLRDARKAL
jgi:hypothetical protein